MKHRRARPSSARSRQKARLRRVAARPKTLPRSGEGLALAVAGANDGVWDWNLETNEIYFSPRCKSILGYDYDTQPDDINELLTCVHPGDREGLAAAFTAYVEGAAPNFQHEYRLLCQDGTYRSVLVRGLVLRDATGKAQRIAGSVTDLTESKRAEEVRNALVERLRQSEERFALAVAGTNDGVWDWNLKTHEVYLSARWKGIIGYADVELESRIEEWHRRIHLEDIDRVAADLGEHLAGLSAYFRSEHRLRHKDGTYRWVLARGLLLRNCEDQPYRMAGSLTDITERKHVDLALKESEERYRRLVELCPDAIAVHSDGKFLFVNMALVQLLGVRSADELVGRPILDFVHPDSQSHVQRRLNEMAERQHGVPIAEERFTRLDGTVLDVEVTTIPFTYEGRQATQVVARDITQRKRGEDVRAELEEKLRQAEKLDAVGRLAEGVAHDFNNQLTIIKGCAQFLLTGLSANDALRRDAERINATVDRGTQLVRQLMAFSRQQPSEPTVLDLAQVLREMTPMLRLLLGEQITLRVETAPSLWCVRADRVQLERVIMNLFANAKDAILDVSDGVHTGTVTVAAVNVEPRDAAAGASDAAKAGGYVTLTVTDTGCGMTPEVRERIFEPYFTTKQFGKGTGLGLPMALAVIKQHGGRIACTSEPGQGTTFHISLPGAESAARIAAPSQSVRERRPAELFAAYPMRQKQKSTVLIAEDERDVRELLKELLSEAGYVVHAAEHPEDAVTVAAQLQRPIDLLITDVVMPGGSGPGLARHLMKRHPSMKVLLVSGYEEYAHDHQLLPGSRYLQKPFSFDLLLRNVRELLGA